MHSTSVCYLVKKLITIATDLGPINLVRVSCPLCCINVNMSYRIQVFLNIHFCSCSSVSTELLVCFNCAHVLLWYCCLRFTAIVFDWHVFIVYSEMYWYSNKLFWIEIWIEDISKGWSKEVGFDRISSWTQIEPIDLKMCVWISN